jgi:site-specific DNA-methyltransferase (cytosine-N4-specific)
MTQSAVPAADEMNYLTLPTHTQLTLPLLSVLNEHPGLSPKNAAVAVAEKLGLDSSVTDTKVTLSSGDEVNVFQRRVRWVRQTLVGEKMIADEKRGWWELTEKAKNFVINCRPGVVVTVYENEYGEALWAEAETATAYVRDESVDLLLTSPPYPLSREKAYGNRKGDDYLDWLTSLAESWKPKLANTGSLVINLQDVYQKGLPVLSLYQEKLLLRLVEDLGYSLCQKFSWHNPSKPVCTDWVTVKRTRVKSGLENFYWLGKTPNPKSSNLRVLRPYGKTMLRTLAKGKGDSRTMGPSGHNHLTPGFMKDWGGSIPDNLLHGQNSTSNDDYCRGCRADGIPIHPARFPDEPLEFLVKLLTEPNDLVWDPMAGSLKVGEVCTRLGRQWIANEKSLAYLYGGRHRFSGGSWTGPNPLDLQRAMAGC